MQEKPPADAAGTPQEQYLYAVFNTTREAQQAEQSLAALHVPAQRLQGAAASRDRRNEADESGVLPKFERFIKGIGGEDLEAQRYAIHLEHGRVVLAMPCPDQSMADTLTRSLVQHGAYDVTYFSHWTIQHMSPTENAERGMPTYEASTGADELITGDLLHRPESRH